MASTHTQYTPTQQAWRDAVAIVTLRAKDKMGAAYHSRLDKAQALVLECAITPHDDGHSAIVQSATDKGKAYEVNGACDCVDASRGKAPEGWCKHRLAWALYRRAVQHGQALLVARTEAPAPAASTLPEAPVSVTLKGTVRGRPNTLVTVRGTTLAEVQAQLDAAAGLFDAAPVADGAQEPARCREVPSALHAGAEDPETAPYCQEHDTAYYKNTSKDGKHPWWSHRLADGSGFCRYKPAKG